MSINCHLVTPVAHEVSAAREPISVAEKQQQLTSRLSRRLRYIRVSI